MIKIICDKCGKEIKALSNKINIKKGNGIELNRKHYCAKCIYDSFGIKLEDDIFNDN